MIELIPTSKTTMDWSTFIRIVDKVLGKKITKDLDARKVPIESNSQLIEILNGLGINGNLYASYGFLVISSKDFFFRLMQYRPIPMTLNVLECYHPDYFIGFLYGTVEQYKRLIIELSEGNETYDLRKLANELQRYFENTEGMYSVFKGHLKRSLPDGSTKLIESK